MRSCHQLEPGTHRQGRSLVLVGNPNVGKSVFFNDLTHGYAEVSNYPGTTLTINAAPMGEDTLLDAPGTYSLSSPEPEARAALEVLEGAAAVVNVVDATSLERDLYLTLQLCDSGLPMVVALNMWDEVEAGGIRIDTEELARQLGVEVVPTTAVTGFGLPKLRTALERTRPGHHLPGFEELLHVSGDPDSPDHWNFLHRGEPEDMAEARVRRIREIIGRVVDRSGVEEAGLGRLEELLMEPRTGVPISLLVVGVAFYLIGKLVAQDLVGLTEGTLMGEYYEPAMRDLVSWLFAKDSALFDLLAGDFGILTMTVTYILGLLLPLILAFYFLMALLEDSGYLPRLALLGDRALRRIGLNGRAIIPMILGLGCVTMATMTTRILNTQRERNITLALLALSVPCSAQLGVIMVLLAGLGLEYWLAYVFIIVLLFAVVGALLDRLLPGDPSPLLMELPRLRRPRFKPVFYKTTYRTWAFLKEAVPIFALGAFILGLLELSGGLEALQAGLEPLTVGLLHLPPEAARAFLMGFVRRDFGAAGLYDLELSGVQTLVSLVVITLFVPCVASALMIAKERGLKGIAVIWGFCIVVAFTVGAILAALFELMAEVDLPEPPALPLVTGLVVLAGAVRLGRRQGRHPEG